MSNTNLKISIYAALGYVSSAEQAAAEVPQAPTVEDNQIAEIIPETVKDENILPDNRSVIQTLQIQNNYGGLRV